MSERRALLRIVITAVIALAAMAAAGTSTAVGAGGSVVRVTRVMDVAGRSPFTGRHCNVATPYYTSPGGKEGEPSVAVDPTHPRKRIVSYMDAARATVNVAWTRNGGRRWRHSVPRGVDGCTGNHTNRWEASGDPWVSVGPDGTAYLSALTWAHFVTPPTSDYISLVHVQTSHNGGRTWSKPRYVAGHHAVSDKPMVLADPHHAGVAYLIWRNQGFGLATGKRARTRLLFARTSDAGRSWSKPIVIARGATSDFFGSPQVSVSRGGVLVATSSLADPSGGSDLLSWRSTDGGRHWTNATMVTHVPQGGNPTFCGQTAAGGDTSSSSGQQTVSRGRAVDLVYLNGRAAAAGRGRIVLAQSTDAGRSWHTRTVVRSRDPLLLASVSAGRRGRLGLVWDRIDTAHIDCGSGRVPTRTLFKAHRAGRPGWTRPVVVGPTSWNLAAAKRGSGGFSGYFVGDYQALAPTPQGWSTASVQGRGLAAHRPHVARATGVVVADVRVPRR